MKNLFISNLHLKDVDHFTTNTGLKLRRTIDVPFKKICNIFTNANIIRKNIDSDSYIDIDNYDIKPNKNNIILEKYPKLDKDEPYIFVCNHTCPEDIETVLNIIDRNTFLILGSIESLQTNPEMYLTFLNGMIPFDILDKGQRKLVFEKMKRVIKTNSILIFPEGSHNYSPNNLINPLFDGPVNLALQTNRKIVPISLIRENNVSFIDVGDPIDVRNVNVDMNRTFSTETEKEKYYVNSITTYIRDVMATSVYNIMVRHFKMINRSKNDNLEEKMRMAKIEDSFKKLKWTKDIFDAEFLVKVPKEEKELEEVATTMANLVVSGKIDSDEYSQEWVARIQDIKNKNVALRMSQHLKEVKTKKIGRRN